MKAYNVEIPSKPMRLQLRKRKVRKIKARQNDPFFLPRKLKGPQH